LYCATQENAKIVKYLEKNPMCAFEIAPDTPPYRGIRGNGVATIRKDIGGKILNDLMGKYLKNQNSQLANFLRDNAENEVAIEINPKKNFSYDYSKRMSDSI
jgi:hypothetical protein